MPKRNFATPTDIYGSMLQWSLMVAEANMVIGLRMLGMAGLWPVNASESTRMFTEKPDAFARSAQAGFFAAASGQRPDQVFDASLRPIRRKTKQNARRLSRAAAR